MKSIATLKKQIKSSIKKVAKERDALRKLVDEASDYEENWAAAKEDLESAVDRLSELL